jgi:high-affinity iron transporter
VKINLSKFFTYSGVALIVVAAGVLSHGIGEFLDLGWIPGGGEYAWKLSWLHEDSFPAALLNGTIGFSNEQRWVQLVIWAGYLAFTLSAYLAPKKVKTPTHA